MPNPFEKPRRLSEESSAMSESKETEQGDPLVESRVEKILNNIGDEENKKEVLVRETERTIAELTDELQRFPAELHGAGFQDLVNSFKPLKEEPNASKIAREWKKYMQSHFPADNRIQEIGRLAYMHVDDDYEGWSHYLNDKFIYKVEDNGKTVSLHLSEAQELSPIELRKKTLEAFQRLAGQLAGTEQVTGFESENLTKVESVRIKSWIVREHPKIAEKMGFTINDKSDELGILGKKEWGGSMDRDDFIQRYISQDTKK